MQLNMCLKSKVIIKSVLGFYNVDVRHVSEQRALHIFIYSGNSRGSRRKIETHQTPAAFPTWAHLIFGMCYTVKATVRDMTYISSITVTLKSECTQHNEYSAPLVHMGHDIYSIDIDSILLFCCCDAFASNLCY